MLEAGQTLSHYRLIEKIGEGGMGVVWRAEDTKLRRQVALKFLPEEIVRDPGRLARFEREARMLAALNDSNVAAIHEMDHAEGEQFLVLEYVPGVSLADRLKKGSLPIQEALKVCCDLARGLEAAHAKGMIHRDLKPANVQLTPEGKVKVLDFGLAKALGGVLPADERSQQMTVTAATGQHTVVGTVPYMSPEQAAAMPVDRRTDIWAFGCILYELLAGQRAFGGETVSNTLTKIQGQDPDWERLPVETPRGVRRLLRRCLAKDVDRRLRDIGDARIEIEDTVAGGEGPSSASAAGAETEKRGWTALRAPIVAGAVIIVAAAIASVLWFWPDIVPGDGRHSSSVRLDLSPITSGPSLEQFPSLSPDGRMVVYAARLDEGNWDILTQRVGGARAINLTADHAGNDTMPAVSPDGESIVFRSDRQGGGLFVMGATGESVRQLTDFGFNPAWSPDGREVVFATYGVTFTPQSAPDRSELWVVNAATGAARKVYDGAAVQPTWSPRSHRIAFYSWETEEKSGQRDIWTIPVAGGNPEPVTQDAATDWNPVWSHDGKHLYFVSDRGGSHNIWRIPIDERSGRAHGAPEPVTIGAVGMRAHPALSADGARLVFAEHLSKSHIVKVAFDPDEEKVVGEPIPITRGSVVDVWPDISPNGEWVAFTSQDDLFLVRSDGGKRRKVTDDVHRDRAPRWSPDGNRIVFYSNRLGSYELFSVRPDGSDLLQLTKTPGENPADPFWSPDGRRVACSLRVGGSIFDLSVPLEERDPQRLPPIDNDGSVMTPHSWSPDGRLLAGSSTGGLYIFSLDTANYTHVATFEDPIFIKGALWLNDSQRLLVSSGGTLYVVDTRNGRRKEILTGPWQVSISTDLRWIFFTQGSVESDIWIADVTK